MDKQETGAFKAELRYFTGSETIYRHGLFHGYVYTEGVQYLAERGGAYWLIDHILANQALAVLKGQPFQVWKMAVNDDESARIAVEDGNGHELTFFHLGYTDFPLEEMTLWLVDKTLLLPSEY